MAKAPLYQYAEYDEFGRGGERGITAVVTPQQLQLAYTDYYTERILYLERVGVTEVPDPSNFFGSTCDINTVELLQEVEVLSAKERANHKYGSAYYQDALQDVKEVIKRLQQ